MNFDIFTISIIILEHWTEYKLERYKFNDKRPYQDLSQTESCSGLGSGFTQNSS